MYAVFRAGGKQYRASEGERLKLEKLDAEEGADVSFDEVLLVGEGSDVKVGSPVLANTTVSARVLKQGRGGKIGVTKFKRRTNYLRQHNHRQWFTEVEITAIGAAGGAPKKAKAAAPAGESEARAEAPAGESEAKPAATKKTTKKKVTKKAATKSASGKKTAKKTTTKKKTTKKTAARDD